MSILKTVGNTPYGWEFAHWVALRLKEFKYFWSYSREGSSDGLLFDEKTQKYFYGYIREYEMDSVLNEFLTASDFVDWFSRQSDATFYQNLKDRNGDSTYVSKEKLQEVLSGLTPNEKAVSSQNSDIYGTDLARSVAEKLPFEDFRAPLIASQVSDGFSFDKSSGEYCYGLFEKGKLTKQLTIFRSQDEFVGWLSTQSDRAFCKDSLDLGNGTSFIKGQTLLEYVTGPVYSERKRVF